MTDFTLSQMVGGFLLSHTTQALSAIDNYRHFLSKFASSSSADHWTLWLVFYHTLRYLERLSPHA